MNATLNPALASTASSGSRPFFGLGNLVRKDLREWLHGRRLWIVLSVSIFAFAGSAANAAINQWVRANLPASPGEALPPALSLAPMDNLLLAVGTQFFVIAAIFATMSLLVSERETGTLAWTVSKPVSRTSVLLSKWLTSTLLLWVAAVIVPLAVTTALVGALYGTPDVGAVVVLGVGLLAGIGLFVAVSLTAAVLVPSQAGVAAIGLAAFFLPSIVAGIVPAVGPVMPTAIVGWVVTAAFGGPAPIVTPIALAAGLVALFAVAKNRFEAMEL